MTALCPASVGFWFFHLHTPDEDGHGRWQSSTFLLHRGEPVDRGIGPRFLDERVRVLDDGKTSLTLVIDDGIQPARFVIERRLSELLPNLDRDENRWQIGLSVDARLRFTFHAIDERGARKDTPLGELIPHGLVEV